MVQYIFKEPLTIKNAKVADPQVIGEALERVGTDLGGRVTPKAVVAAAYDDASPLHPHFEWDDTVAANQYRLDQARTLIRAIRVEDDDGEVRHGYFSVNDKGGVSYRSLADVVGSRELRLAVLVSAERDLKAWEHRYRDIQDVCEVVSSARETLTERIATAEDRPSA